jgi:hypothetical protein
MGVALDARPAGNQWINSLFVNFLWSARWKIRALLFARIASLCVAVTHCLMQAPPESITMMWRSFLVVAILLVSVVALSPPSATIQDRISSAFMAGLIGDALALGGHCTHNSECASSIGLIEMNLVFINR